MELWKKVRDTSITLSSSHFFNKTDFEQYLFEVLQLMGARLLIAARFGIRKIGYVQKQAFEWSKKKSG